MRTWERTRVVEPCGSCGTSLAVGSPIQVVRLPTDLATSKRRIRCEGCADGPVDLEQLERFDVTEDGKTQAGPVAPTQAFAFKGATRSLFDPKMAAAGPDEE